MWKSLLFLSAIVAAVVGFPPPPLYGKLPPYRPVLYKPQPKFNPLPKYYHPLPKYNWLPKYNPLPKYHHSLPKYNWLPKYNPLPKYHHSLPKYNWLPKYQTSYPKYEHPYPKYQHPYPKYEPLLPPHHVAEPKCPKKCIFEWNPVCGHSHLFGYKTFSSQCQLESYNECEDGSGTWQVVNHGECRNVSFEDRQGSVETPGEAAGAVNGAAPPVVPVAVGEGVVHTDRIDDSDSVVLAPQDPSLQQPAVLVLNRQADPTLPVSDAPAVIVVPADRLGEVDPNAPQTVIVVPASSLASRQSDLTPPVSDAPAAIVVPANRLSELDPNAPPQTVLVVPADSLASRQSDLTPPVSDAPAVIVVPADRLGELDPNAPQTVIVVPATSPANRQAEPVVSPEAAALISAAKPSDRQLEDFPESDSDSESESESQESWKRR